MTVQFTRQSRIISLTSGKGGVGKTSLAVNLAAELARTGRRTLLADCDFGMANAAMLLGLNTPVTVDDVLAGRLSVDEVVTEADEGLLVLPGSSGTGVMPELGSDARKRLAMGLRPFSRMTDFILVDTPTGISRPAMETVSSADSVILVMCDEPTAFMDAYSTARILTLDYQCTSLHVITNMVANEAAGRNLFARFQDVTSRFLPVSVNLLGSVPADRHMREAVMHKKPCVLAYPHSPAATAIARIAARIGEMRIGVSAGGNHFLGQEASHGLR